MTEAIAARLGSTCAGAVLRHFPDGETYLRLGTPSLPVDVAIVCTLDHPDDKILPLTFVTAAAREHGATRVGLVAPYLAYLRQDRVFQAGETVTSRHFARLLSGMVDWLITVDPHLHRYHALGEIYDIPTKALKAAPLIAQWILTNVRAPLLIGPDHESEQWVQAVARMVAAPYVVLEKVRHGDRDVTVTVPDLGRWRSHTPVLVDDIVSTAHTMIETIEQLSGAGFPAPVCVVTHAIFSGNAYEALRVAGAARIVSTNTIKHPSNAINVSDSIADAIAVS